jgi:hypothetical protein
MGEMGMCVLAYLSFNGAAAAIHYFKMSNEAPIMLLVACTAETFIP